MGVNGAGLLRRGEDRRIASRQRKLQQVELPDDGRRSCRDCDCKPSAGSNASGHEAAGRLAGPFVPLAVPGIARTLAVPVAIFETHAGVVARACGVGQCPERVGF